MGLFNRIIDKMVSDKVPFKKRKRLIVFVAIITLLSMTTATVAWFSVNTFAGVDKLDLNICLLYTSPSPRDREKSRMPSSA